MGIFPTGSANCTRNKKLSVTCTLEQKEDVTIYNIIIMIDRKVTYMYVSGVLLMHKCNSTKIHVYSDIFYPVQGLFKGLYTCYVHSQ